MRRFLTLCTSGVLIVAGLTGLGPAAAVAAPAAVTPCAAGTPVVGDYNGDGQSDLAVMVDDNWVDESLVFVSLDRTNTGTWLDVDGAELRSADLNGDICSDALLGGWPVGVQLVFGTPAGLDPASVRTITLPQSAGLGEGDQVKALAVGFRHDGISQVVVGGSLYLRDEFESSGAFVDVFTLDTTGVPGTPQVLDMSTLVPRGTEWPLSLVADAGVVVGSAPATVDGKLQAGAVHVFTPGAADPVLLEHRAVITQASPGVAGAPETGDDFGRSLALRAGHLAVGVPGESLGAAKRTGQVQLLQWDAGLRAFTPVRALSQNTSGVPGSNESGDRFGRKVAIARGLTASGSFDVVIGTPQENAGSIIDAGSVTVANFTAARYRAYSHNTAGVPGSAEKLPSEAVGTGEYFGYGIGLLPTSGSDILAIGAPGETNGRCLTQGYVILSDGEKLGSSTEWTYLKPPTQGCSGYDLDVFNGWGNAFGN